jgi:hypothetical protein
LPLRDFASASDHSSLPDLNRKQYVLFIRMPRPSEQHSYKWYAVNSLSC